MIIAKSEENGVTFLLLGLSRENIQRLTVFGEPIRISRKSHGDAIPDNLRLGIVFGETELEMKKELERLGFITPETKTTVDPRLKK